MAFCKNCGKQIGDNTAFCPACGTPTGAQAPAGNPNPGFNPNPNPNPGFNPGPEPTPIQPQVMGGDADVQANKGIAWLSYLGILFLIPLFARKTSYFCRYHVKQGATLFACNIAYTIVTEIIKAILRVIFPAQLKYSVVGTYYYAENGIVTVISILFGLVGIAFLVFAIMGIINAATGKLKELPLFGQIPIISDLLDNIYYNK